MAMTAAMRVTIDKSFRFVSGLSLLVSMTLELTNGRRPIRSIKNQGMKEATKNHVFKKPDMSPAK